MRDNKVCRKDGKKCGARKGGSKNMSTHNECAESTLNAHGERWIVKGCEGNGSERERQRLKTAIFGLKGLRCL